MDINIQSQIGNCEEFISVINGEKEVISIVISPIKVISTGESDIRVINGCNMWGACKNKRCYFSSEARKLPKIKGSS